MKKRVVVTGGHTVVADSESLGEVDGAPQGAGAVVHPAAFPQAGRG